MSDKPVYIMGANLPRRFCGSTMKNSRPNVTYPSPDPEKEKVCPEYKKGDEVMVKPGVFFEGLDLSGRKGYIRRSSSYLEVQISMDMPSINEDGVRILAYNTATFQLLRYEVEPYVPPVIDRTW